MAKPPSNARYEVGYGKPPVDRQFAKGRSGNPGGRPKSKLDAQNQQLPTDIARQILADANQPLKIRTAEGEVSISSLSAVIQATKAKALKGHSPAQKVYLDVVKRAETSDNERWRRECEIINRFKDRYKYIVAGIESEGMADKIFVPHPDDVELDYEAREIKYLGPQDWDSYRFMQATLKLRDQMLWALGNWDRISCEPELSFYIGDRIAARWNTVRYLSWFLPERFALGPLEDYVFRAPYVEPNRVDCIIFGAISPVPPGFARMFQADPAAERAFFDGQNFLQGSGLIADRYSPYFRPFPGLAMTHDTRLKVESKLARVTDADTQRRALNAISRDKTLPLYVIFNAQWSLCSGERRGADWMLDDFRKSLY